MTSVCKKKHGQYFTSNIHLQNKIYEFILNDPKIILEPCVGRGDLVDFILQKKSKCKFDMYEIDKNLSILQSLNNYSNKIIYGDFLKLNINKFYKTIIGNPPYIRTKNGNLYIDFIKKCFNLLEDKGELIFIVPSDFFKLTSSSKLIELMMKDGTFTHIFHPHDEKMFENAIIDIIIFRYCKNASLEKKVKYYNNSKLSTKFIQNNSGLITFFSKENKNNLLFKDLFNIYVGMVTGNESVFKNSELGNIDVLNGKNILQKYIFIESFPTNNTKINDYLNKNKSVLLKRKIRKFDEHNWFEWGAPRNIKTIQCNLNKECIYINTITRNDKVAFLGKVNYFSGQLIMLLPKKKCNLNKIINYLNSDLFKENFIFSGRFKIGHRQISNSNILI